MATLQTPQVKSTNLWWLRYLLPPVLFFLAGLSLIFLLGLAQRLGWIEDAGGVQAVGQKAPGVIYTCPMHPQIRQPMPGRCPICGMELVPASQANEKNDPLAVEISPVARRVGGIKTVPVRWETLSRSLRTVGVIAYDESRLASIAAYVDGRIEKMYADYTGVNVEQGDHLAVLYSPNLYSAQVEYLQSQETLRSLQNDTQPFVLATQKRLVENAGKKLLELGMTPEQIAGVEKSRQPMSRLTIFAPIGGTVIEKMAEHGQYVKTGQVLYKIADLSTVWLMLKLFPDDSSKIRFGQIVEAKVSSLPGQKFIGRVAFIDPMVNMKTRTVSVRVEMLNVPSSLFDAASAVLHGMQVLTSPLVPILDRDINQGLQVGQRLRPGDFADATITIPIGKQGMVYDSALAGKWISPMHPQIVRDNPGKCPICGMDLIAASRFGYSPNPVPRPEGLVVPRNAVLFTGNDGVVYVETEPGRFEIRRVTMGPFLKDRIVILEGLEEGEMVATSGNFLIDSQMQLEGKPSIIDPSKISALPSGPMRLLHFEQTRITGKAGMKLESIYAIYFRLEQQLAADQKVQHQDAVQVHASALQLKNEPSIPRKFHPLLTTIAKESEHLHHQNIKEARKQFKILSAAM
ncbi:MAG: efflux RND transporter periplasmic adaptor subunit, partial [Bdellovibrionales bacterium]